MNAYLITTGTVFGLITLAHLARIVAEWPRLLIEPLFLGLTVFSAVLCFWAFRLLRRASQE